MVGLVYLTLSIPTSRGRKMERGSDSGKRPQRTFSPHSGEIPGKREDNTSLSSGGITIGHPGNGLGRVNFSGGTFSTDFYEDIVPFHLWVPLLSSSHEFGYSYHWASYSKLVWLVFFLMRKEEW